MKIRSVSCRLINLSRFGKTLPAEKYVWIFVGPNFNKREHPTERVNALLVHIHD